MLQEKKNWNNKERYRPCYEDKVGRRSIRVMDLRSESNLDSRLENVFLHHNAIRKGLKKKYIKKKI